MEYNPQQIQALECINNFLEPGNTDKLFILKGSAGTGKTTLLNVIAGELCEKFGHVMITAPTHRAAKVLSKKTGKPAKTLHSLLYDAEPLENGYGVRLRRKTVFSKEPTLHIVDEASMIGDRVTASREFSCETPLLTDLLHYVSDGNADNKILFVGDPCQLPPVGYNFGEQSPALFPRYFEQKFGISGKSFELTEIVRQHKDSYILKGAQLLRRSIREDKTDTTFYKINLPNPSAAVKQYMRCYRSANNTAVKLIASTNKNVNWWNYAIRKQLGYAPAKPEVGDKVVIDRSWTNGNYILTNGDTGIIFEVDNTIETFGGLRFMKVKLLLDDIADDPVIIETLLNLNHLYSEKGWLTEEQEKAMIHEAMKCNPAYRSSRDIRRDPYLNAVRLRYAYALTCHKAQGSEFDNVILHPYYGQDKVVNLRYLYTAVTRAKQNLYSYEMKIFNR
jgi:exodeoxyribonuclease-5